MQDYPLRRGHAKRTDLRQLMQAAFGPVRDSGGWLECSFGAMPKIRAKYDGTTKLVMDTESDRSADVETAQRTIKAWNAFLEAATGYNAKQRGKKTQQEVKKGEAAAIE